MHLRTFGGLELVGSSFSRPKPLLLLTYLALEGPKERRHIAELFWLGATDPLNRLAVTLARLKKADEALIATDTLRVRTDITTDAHRLLIASGQAQHKEVVDLYQGPFLDGLYLDDWSSELEEWVYGTRDFLAAQVKVAQLALAEHHAQQGRFQEAARHAESAYKVAQTAGLEPEDIRRVHSLLLAGNHPQAMAVRGEAEAFEVSLVQTVEEARTHFGYMTSPPTNLIRPMTSFVGRQREMAELNTLLSNPDARLVTVLGIGGAGKTRLATELARQHLDTEQFRDGVFFIALDAISSSLQLPNKIAEAVGVELEGAEAPIDQIQASLRTKNVLLVLDNFEHVVEGAPLVAELLQACLRLKILVTSRERLNISEEWIFALEGLSFSQPVDHGQLITDDAPRLFFERARQVQPTLRLTLDAVQAVHAICRLVEGSPLGLELAATLTRVMTPAEIAEELARTIDLLESPTRNLPERHRSLRAVFQHSWKLLTPREQEALRKLAVFRGGFTRAAAAEVTGVTIPLLMSLGDKSLLRVSETGRYDRHPLLYGYTQEKLAEHPVEEAEVRAKHATFFSRFSAGLRLEFNGPDPKGTFTRLAADFENCRAAWCWALDERNVGVMLGFTNAFWFYYGIWEGSEATHAWAEAIAVLDENDPAQREALGVFLALQAQYYSTRSFDLAKPMAERALALLRPLGHKMGTGMSLHVLAGAAMVEGRFDEALALTHEIGEETVPDLRGQHPSYVALLEMNRGNYPEAKAWFLEALAISQGDHFTRSVVYALQGLGDVHFYEGDYEVAQRYYRKSLSLARERGFEPGGGNQENRCLLKLGEVALKLNELDEAARLAEDVLSREERPVERAWALILPGQVAAAKGEFEQATEFFRRSLKILAGRAHARRIAADQEFSGILLAFTELWVRLGKDRPAAEVIGFLLGHLHFAYEKALAEQLREAVEANLSVEELEEALEQGEVMKLEEVIQKFLVAE